MQEDSVLFPTIKYFTVAALGEAAAILKTSGLKLHQSAYDAEFFYEQFPRVCDEIDSQFQKSSANRYCMNVKNLRQVKGRRRYPVSSSDIAKIRIPGVTPERGFYYQFRRLDLPLIIVYY